MTNWQAQSILYVWFLNSMEGVRINDMFERITGTEPDNYQNNKSPNPGNPFLAVAAGNVGDKNFLLQLQPGRIDLVVTPLPTTHEGSEPLFDIAPTLTYCTGLILQADLKISSVIRQGVVVNAAVNVTEPRVATDMILELAGYNPEIEDLLDLNIQVNKRKSSATGLGLNRVLRYSVQTVQEFALQLGHGGNMVPITKQTFLASVVIDINTASTNAPIALGDQMHIFTEMSDEALRIASAPTVKAL